MAFFQMVGGKHIAKLPDVNFKSAYFICLAATIVNGLLVWLIGKMDMLPQDGKGVIIVVSISIILLVIAAKLIWKCSSVLMAIKASSINIILNVIFWSYILTKYSSLFFR